MAPDPPARRRKTIKNIELNNYDRELSKALQVFHHDAYVQKFGPPSLFGPNSLLSNKIVHEITCLTKLSALKTVDDLKFETQWVLANIYGNDILQIVGCFPPPEKSSTSASIGPSEPKTMQRKCGSCRQLGHTSE